jgi:hypothetical protein
VGNEDEGGAAVDDFADALKTLLGKEHVAHAEGFINNQDVGLDADGDGEGESHHHAGRVSLHRLFDEVADVGEGGDFIEAPGHLRAGQAIDRAIEKNVLAAGELGVEAGAELEEGGDAAVDVERTGGDGERAGDELEQSGFAGAVATDDAGGLAAADFKRDVV